MVRGICQAEQEATIEQVVLGGEGVARTPDGVIFLSGVLPGERVVYRVAGQSAAFRRGELLAVLEPSPDRVMPECPLARPSPIGCLGGGLRSACPGCVYAHVKSEAEVRLKQAQLLETLRRLGGLSLEALEGIGSPISAIRAIRYRNKAVFHVARSGKEWQVGYYGLDNQTILDVPDCLLTVEPIAEAYFEQRRRPEWPHTLRDGMTVTFRWTQRDGVVWWRNRSDPRTPWLTEEAGGLLLRVPADSFFQINPWMTACLVSEVEAVIREVQPGAVVDLYCGSGLFSMAAFRAGVSRGWGVEVDGRAVEAAGWNARQAGMTGYTFAACSVERGLRGGGLQFSANGLLAIVDPPRGGLSEAVRQRLLQLSPRDILYISCACDTLARDLRSFWADGRYRVRRICLLDLFPRTAHFETLVWMRKEAS